MDTSILCLHITALMDEAEMLILHLPSCQWRGDIWLYYIWQTLSTVRVSSAWVVCVSVAAVPTGSGLFWLFVDLMASCKCGYWPTCHRSRVLRCGHRLPGCRARILHQHWPISFMLDFQVWRCLRQNRPTFPCTRGRDYFGSGECSTGLEHLRTQASFPLMRLYYKLYIKRWS